MGRKSTSSAQENKQASEAAYQAFGNGDAAGAMANMDDSIVWNVRGDNALTGTYAGKEKIGGLWAQLAGKEFATVPSEFIADGNKVIVLTTDTYGGETENSANILGFNGDGRLISFDSIGDPAIADRIFAR